MHSFLKANREKHYLSLIKAHKFCNKQLKPSILIMKEDLECLQPHNWLLWKPYCPSRCCCPWCSSFSFECPPFVVVSFSFQTYWKYSREMSIAQGSIWWMMITLENKYEQFIIHKSHRHEVKSLTLVHFIWEKWESTF